MEGPSPTRFSSTAIYNHGGAVDSTPRASAFRLAAMLVDALGLYVIWIAVLQLRVWLPQVWSFDVVPGTVPILGVVSLETHRSLVWLVLPIWLASLGLTGTYKDLRRVRLNTMLVRASRAVVLAVLALLGLLFALGLSSSASRTLLLGFSVGSILVILMSRLATAVALRRLFSGFGIRHLLLVADRPQEAAALAATIRHHPEWGIHVQGVVTTSEPGLAIDGAPCLGTVADLPQIVQDKAISEVMVVGTEWDFETLRRVADSCEEIGVQFTLDANFLGLRTARAGLASYDGWTVVTFSSTPTDTAALVLKRLMDIGLALVGLAAATPILLLTALAIKLDDGGPVLFVQERRGLFGRPFPLIKFRSMELNAESRRPGLEALNELNGPAFKLTSDPRITRVGAFLRKSSIDELPQLLNVLRGEMSLVGPRPPLPDEVDKYERWQMRRLSMRPGLTCIWQVKERGNTDFDTWMSLDLEYIDNWSLLMDMKLLMMTVPVVLLGTGAR